MTALQTDLTRASLTALADSIRLQKAHVERDLQSLTHAKAFDQLISINTDFQEELNRVYSIYAQIIDRIIQNIKTQYSIRSLFHTRLTQELSFEPLDSEAINQMVQEKLGAVKDLATDLKDMHIAVAILRKRMVILTELPNPGQPVPGFWDIMRIQFC